MFGKNLKYYRLKKNMTKKDLAKKCDITPMAISNYESGKRNPDMPIIKRLAKALDVHVADFLKSGNENLVFSHCEFRKNTKLTVMQQEYVRESVEEYFGRFYDAVEFVSGDPLPPCPDIHKLKTSGDYNRDARQLRDSLGFSFEGPIDDIVNALENKGFLMMEIAMDDDFSGMNGTVNGRPYIVINSNMNAERKRTTIVHELAHIMFIWGDDDTDNETYATQIAGAFLIPDSDLVRELGIHRSSITKDMVLTCQEYGISMYLLVMRARQVKIITDNLAKSFYIWANKAGWRKNEPSRVHEKEEPKLFRQLVYRAVNEEGVSPQKGAELLNIPLSEVEEYCGKMEENK